MHTSSNINAVCKIHNHNNHNHPNNSCSNNKDPSLASKVVM